MENTFTDGSLSSPSKNLIGWLVNAKRILLFNQASFTSEFDQSNLLFCLPWLVKIVLRRNVSGIQLIVDSKFPLKILVTSFFWLVMPNPVNFNLNWSVVENENSGVICVVAWNSTFNFKVMFQLCSFCCLAEIVSKPKQILRCFEGRCIFTEHFNLKVE